MERFGEPPFCTELNLPLCKAHAKLQRHRTHKNPSQDAYHLKSSENRLQEGHVRLFLFRSLGIIFTQEMHRHTCSHILSHSQSLILTPLVSRQRCDVQCRWPHRGTLCQTSAATSNATTKGSIISRVSRASSFALALISVIFHRHLHRHHHPSAPRTVFLRNG